MQSSEQILVEFVILYKIHSHMTHYPLLFAIQVINKEGPLFMASIADILFKI